MNHFDAVDFSECHSEEVMFLLTLSVDSNDLISFASENCINFEIFVNFGKYGILKSYFFY